MGPVEWYGVFEWREDARYFLEDVKGCRVFKTARGAERHLERIQVLRMEVHTSLVVRSSLYVRVGSAVIAPSGRVSLRPDVGSLVDVTV